MTDQRKRPVFNFYIDDSGTRHPNKSAPTSSAGDWFGLGGFLIREEDEQRAREQHQVFCGKWQIAYPLHSVKIRHKTDEFSWLAQLSQHRLREFYTDIDALVIELPIIAHACVIHRPGYHARYYEKHAAQRWHLCKTAFTILAERAAKFSTLHDRRVRLIVEESDKKSDNRIREYFRAMRDTGMPFDGDRSSQYGPLSPHELQYRLLDLSFKRKSSPMIQLADLVLYPLCRAPYDMLYRPMKSLRDNRLLLDSHLAEDQVRHIGIKYSCFDK